MRQNAAQSAIAERMRQALRKAGLSQAEAARRLGYKQSTFNRWLTGARRPEDSDIDAFARLTGTTAAAIIHGQVAPFKDWAIRFADLVYSGSDPASAIEEVSAAGAKSEDLSDPERLFLSRAAEGMRSRLRDESGGAWDRLTAEQKWAVLQKIEGLAQENEGLREPVGSDDDRSASG